MLRPTRLGYHRAVAGLASAGNDVVMDYPLSELERRERDRGDRPAGLSRSQTMVYAHGEHDIAVDTTRARPEECATTIAGALDALPSPKAFERLRRRNASRGPRG